MDKETLMEMLTYLASTEEVKLFNKYQRMLQEILVKEKTPIESEPNKS